MCLISFFFPLGKKKASSSFNKQQVHQATPEELQPQVQTVYEILLSSSGVNGPKISIKNMQRCAEVGIRIPAPVSLRGLVSHTNN